MVFLNRTIWNPFNLSFAHKETQPFIKTSIKNRYNNIYADVDLYGMNSFFLVRCLTETTEQRDKYVVYFIKISNKIKGWILFFISFCTSTIIEIPGRTRCNIDIRGKVYNENTESFHQIEYSFSIQFLTNPYIVRSFYEIWFWAHELNIFSYEVILVLKRMEKNTNKKKVNYISKTIDMN